MTEGPQRNARRVGFTLVELLVVIGIIAVLIGILLPALASARRSASAMKCASQMRQVGMTFQMYAIDNHGYWPPCRLGAAYTLLYGKTSITSNPVYWQNFLAKYVTKAVVGMALTTNPADLQLQVQLAKSSILWGCPDFTPIATTSSAVNGESVIYTGYGMNLDPHYPNAPASATPPYTFEDQPLDRAYNPPLSGAPTATFPGTWFKAKEWTRPAERCLIADGRVYSIDSRQPPTGSLPDSVTGQHTYDVSSLWSAVTGNNQTTMDIYRHGKAPRRADADSFSKTGGKISFNILYCDGHVVTCIHGSDAYRSIRMKFPG